MPKSAKRVLKNSFFQTFGAFGISGLNFLLTVAYARILGPESYGSLVTSQAQVLVWSLLVDLGLSNALIGALTAASGERSELSRQGFRARDMVARVLWLRCLGATLGAFFICAASFAKHDFLSESFFQDIAFVPHLYAIALQQTAAAFASYRQRQGLSVAVTLFGVFLTVVLTIFLAYQKSSLSILLLSQSWGGIFSAAVIFIYFFYQTAKRKRLGKSRRKEKTKKGEWRSEAWGALARDAWPYAITIAVMVLWQRLDQIAVSHILGLESGGQYALAVRLVAIPILVATSVSFAIFPDLQRVGIDAPEKVNLILSVTSKLIYRYGILFGGVIAVAAGLLISPLVPKFKPALEILPFFIPGIWGYWLQSIFINSLFGLREYKIAIRVHIYSLFIYVACLCTLPFVMGIYGVVLSFNVFCLSMSFFGYLAAKKANILSPTFRFFGSFSENEKQFLNNLAFWKATK
ncbi:MAG: oligosaccharide flippase family protein [Oligoflexia bacterium]|nr:oligosaccharide flippase family protein [Oligoflexia bacterium]